ncbi:hypothetical protein [Flavobacterium sp.]|uniref:hypothetical protein n=1 Tax=Flavobacterium sp. TaxID=239 RepID=UPI0039E45DF8
MKKLFSLLALLLAIGGYAQKTVEIYNFSSKTVSLSMVVTKPASGTYPWCASVAPSPIYIAPGDSYILENTANAYRFPFHSPGSPTYITNWRRVTAPASPGAPAPWSNMLSTAVWPLGNGQYFDYISFYMNNGMAGSGNIGEPSFWVTANPLINTANQWQVDYSGDFVSPSLYFSTIVFTDI